MVSFVIWVDLVDLINLMGDDRYSMPTTRNHNDNCKTLAIFDDGLPTLQAIAD
jgi:hypothetical protein